MLRVVGLLAAAVGAVVLLITGFGWFGSDTENAFGWLGLFAVGVTLVLAAGDLEAAIGRRRNAG